MEVLAFMEPAPLKVTRMKCTDTDQSFFKPLATLSWVTAVIAGLIPAARAQDRLGTIERAPENEFTKEQEESMAKYLGLGPISVRPHLTVESYYDDNITLGNKDHPNVNKSEREDWVWRISPGVLFGVGEFRGDKGTYVSLDYTLGGRIYTKYHEYNSVDHDVIASGGWKLSKLTLGLSQSYKIDHGKLIELGAFAEEESYITTLTSQYDLSDKTSFQLNGRQAIVHARYQNTGLSNPDVPLNSINEWAVEGWGDYKFSEKVSAGAGVTVGWRDVVPSPNQTFEQILVRSAYQVSEKVLATGSAGVQFSQFENGEDKSGILVFTLGGSWHALENTYLTLEGYRRDVPSYIYDGRNYTLTGTRVAARQNFLEKYSATLAAGYENSDYTETGTTTAPDRNDDYFWIRPEVAFELNERMNMGVFYQYRHKNSNTPDFGYSNNEVGLFANYRF